MDEESQDNNQVEQYYRPKNKEERVARRNIWERYRAMADDELRQEAEQDWDLADKMYRQWMPERSSYDWRAHITLPDGFSAVQAYLQETINRRSRPILQVTNGSDLPRELFVNSILTYNMDVTGYDMEQFKARQCAAIRGDGFVMERYRLDKRDVHDPTSVNEDGTLEYTKREIVDADDTFTEFVENEFIFIDPSARNQNSARDMIEREVLDWDEFQRVYGKKADFMNVELVPKAGSMPDNVGFFQMPKDMTDSDVEILHYYNRSTDSYDALANNVLIHLGYIPFKHKELPYAKYSYYAIPGQFYSMGIPRVILSLTEERKSLRNMAIDRQHMQIDKMFLVNDIVDLDDEDVRTRPNGFIQVNTNGLKINEVITPLEYGDIPASFYQADNSLLEDIRRAHGINEQMEAQSTGGTATEAAQLQQAAQARINMINQISEMETIIRIGRLKWSNIQFFYPAPKVAQITEDDDEREKKVYKQIKVDGMEFTIEKDPNGGGLQIKNNDITGSSGFTLDKTHAKFMQGEFDINVNAETAQLTSKPIRQAKITEMFNLLAINPQLLGSIDPNKAVQRYLEINDEDPKDWMRNSGMTDNDWKRLATHENLVMAQGQVLAPTEDAPIPHTEEHLNFTQTAMYMALPQATKDIFQEHITGEHQNNPTTGNVADSTPTGAPAADSGLSGDTPTGGQTTEIAPVDIQPSTVGGADRRDAQQGSVSI